MKWIYRERHWMHAWKVGFMRCRWSGGCDLNTQMFASLINDDGDVILQSYYCEVHAPSHQELPADLKSEFEALKNELDSIWRDALGLKKK